MKTHSEILALATTAPPLELPVTWQQSTALTLSWLPARSALARYAPEPQWLAASSTQESPMGAALAQRVVTLCRIAQKTEGKTPLEWTATPSSLRARVSGGSFVIASFPI